MITNYLRTSIRSLLRNRFSALINLLGLAAGLSCVIYILLFAYDEYGYDRFHENAEHIYRFNTQFGVQNERVPLGPYLLDDLIYPNIPELNQTTRIRPGENMFLWLTDKENIHVDEGIMLVDSNFFSFSHFLCRKGTLHRFCRTTTAWSLTNQPPKGSSEIEIQWAKYFTCKEIIRCRSPGSWKIFHVKTTSVLPL